jgi:hypothetical protein
VASASVTHSVLHSVPQLVKQTAVQQENISQFELAAICTLRDRAQQIQQQIEEAEASIRARLEAGTEVERGAFHAYLKTVERRSVSWKGVVERELGEDYAVRVLAATRPDKFSTLVIGA